jgi:CheY-like chemotaxis protein/signal transduction histidine kinase
VANSQAVPRELIRLVRDALSHLYDYAHLENHPLATLVDGSGSIDQVTRAQRLRRLLLDCIEEIKPWKVGETASEADRVYAILVYRFVDGLPMDKAADKRGLGERQAYRDLREGVRAVAGLLYDRMRAQEDTGETPGSLLRQPVPGDQVQLARDEVARLRQAAASEPLDLHDLLRGVLNLLTPLCQRTGIQILTFPSGSWPAVIAGRVMLRHALLGLLTHALETTVQGDLTITVCPGPFEVGIEIAQSAVRTRTQPLTPPSDPKTGVGPAVAQALIAAQGGRLETGEREGLWWARVTLPTTSQATILVIDDNSDLVTLLRRYLAGHAVNVVGATDAGQAPRLAQELQPRLITLDVMMPDQDGWEILQRLKGSPATRDIPVVICSVLNEQGLAETMGASGYITKPVSQDDLLAVLSRWLGPLRPTA